MSRRKVLITGAASGIGQATAIRFANEGWEVCLNDIQEEKLSDVFKGLAVGNHLIIPGSYADKKIIHEAEKIIQQNWGSLDVLVNCAGVSRKSNAIKIEIDEWRKNFDTMVNGCVLISQLAVKFMSSGGRVIHVTSIHGSRAEKEASNYSMAKAAINQYCRSMAVDLADKKILVNAIAPGFVNTPMSVTDGINETETQWFKDNYVEGSHLPLRRAGTPEEIAGVAFFLSGKDASYITGQVIVVDGGLTVTF